MSVTEAIARATSRRVSPTVWAALAGIVGFIAAYAVMSRPDQPGDFLYWYTAARVLVSGGNPYDAIPTLNPERFATGFFYPLPAVLLTVPFSFLPYRLAGPLFVALASGLVGYGVAKQGLHRLWLLAGAPYIVSAASGTWSIAVTAAALFPVLGFLACAKPNAGVAAFLYKPSWKMVVGCFLLIALCFAVWPGWMNAWLGEVGGVQNRVVPILTPVGPFLLLALTRWRRPETRLLLGYACVPQAPWFYDQLILALIPATQLEAINYAFVTQLALAGWIMFDGILWSHGNWLLAAVLYLPPLIMILRRSNETPPAAPPN
jgi:hypothetical protein